MVTRFSFLNIEDLGAHWLVDEHRSFVYVLLTALPLPSIYEKINKKYNKYLMLQIRSIVHFKIYASYLVAIFPTQVPCV